jgi:Lar family restriction alleviation protein
MTKPASAPPAELQPCPFCGGNVESYQQTSKVPDNWVVRCDVCGAQCGPSASSAAAKYNWNTRAAASAQVREVEAYTPQRFLRGHDHRTCQRISRGRTGWLGRGHGHHI